MSAAAKRRLSISAAIVIVAVAAFMLAFTPPSGVPYTLTSYGDRAKLINATGMNGLAEYASAASCAGKVNLFSQNVGYSVLVLSLPGRAGLGLSLALTYNSKVWVKSGTTMYFDGDKGWPAPGWRLGFGRIDGKYDGTGNDDHYFLISGDGSVRDLAYNSTSGKYESKDSTYIDFDESTGILRYKDGTQVTYQTISGGGYIMPTQIKDRNGNYLTINYSSNGQNISSIVDTLGRTTSFSYDGNGRLSTISKSGFNNASRTWSFTYTDLTLNYSFASSLTVNGPASSTSIKVLQKITYPNSTDQYFTYNGYAQLTEAAFRSSSGSTRGKFTVSWNSAPGGGWADSPTPATIGNYDGTNTNTWSLSFGSYTSTVTGPDSVAHTTTFLSSPWDGLPNETSIGSTALRTADRDWELDSASLNPRLSQVSTTLKDTTPNLTATVEYDYTDYNNPSEVREYDYGYTLKRKTTSTYVTDSNYTSRHILGLPDTAIVYNGSGTAKSRTEYDYDQSTIGSVSGASNHDGTNYGTGFYYRGNVTTVTRYTNAATPSGSITNTSTYDMVGNLRTESADCCVTKTYNYSDTTEFSQPDSVVRGSGTTLTTEATYDSYTSLLATSEDENEKTTTYTYDTMNRTTNVERSDGTDITTTYDDSSATASTTATTPIDASTSVQQKTEFDGLGRTTRVTTLDASSTVYSKVDTVYDSMGRTWKISLPYSGASASYWTETQYDALSRPTKVIPPDGTSSSNRILYTYANDTVTVEDQTGRKRKSQSDALGRQIKVTEPDPANSDSLTLETTYTYDALGNLTQIDQGSQTRTFVYDDAGRKTSETTPEAGTVSYVYNSDGLLTSRTDARGVVTTYSYDSALNRLTSVSYNVSCCSTVPSTPTVTYTYGTSSASNNNGRLIQMTDGLGEENYTYDSLGHTTQVQKKIYNVTYTTSYTYNLAGGAVTMTYPSGRVVKQENDNVGRLKNVKNNTTSAIYLQNAAYNTANQLTGFTYGNSVAASYGYSANRLQLTSLSYSKSGTTHLSVSYGYSQSGNNNGQIVSITDTQQSGRTVSYTYDSLHRVKTAVTNGSAGYPQWGLSWSYDRYGNRTGQSVTHGSGPSSSPTISTSSNRITALGGSSYYYDANGSLTQDDLFKYKYDAENRVVEIRNLSDTLLSSYAYDGNSMQVIKVVGATRTWFLYAGGQLVSEFSDAASATYSSGTTPGSAPSDGQSTLLYQHADHLTTRVTTDNAGTLSNQQGHYPFGELWYSSGTADPSVERKFTSYRKESGSLAGGQINYAVHRYHGARIGRFHRPDPMRGRTANPQRLNRYGYVLGDPVRRTDRLGLDDMADMIAFAACDNLQADVILCKQSAANLASGGGPPPVLGSLASRPQTFGLDIFDAIQIYMDPDDEEGESDALDSYGFLSNNGVVTINPFGLSFVPGTGMQMATSRNPNAVFLRPNQQPTVNLGIGNFFTQGLWVTGIDAQGNVVIDEWRIDRRERDLNRPSGNPWVIPPPQSLLDQLAAQGINR